MKTMKVFDLQEMPPIIKKAVQREAAYLKYALKDNYFEWDMTGAYRGIDQDDTDFDIINNWMLENGANKLEEVLINYWW